MCICLLGYYVSENYFSSYLLPRSANTQTCALQLYLLYTSWYPGTLCPPLGPQVGTGTKPHPCGGAVYIQSGSYSENNLKNNKSSHSASKPHYHCTDTTSYIRPLPVSFRWFLTHKKNRQTLFVFLLTNVSRQRFTLTLTAENSR